MAVFEPDGPWKKMNKKTASGSPDTCLRCTTLAIACLAKLMRARMVQTEKVDLRITPGCFFEIPPAMYAYVEGFGEVELIPFSGHHRDAHGFLKQHS